MSKNKKYNEVKNKVSKKENFSLDEALALLPEISMSKFVGSVTVEILLNLKEKQKKETIRGSYTLPNKFGKETKVLVFADPNNIKDAETADIKGGEELIDDIQSGKLDFDIVIATPAMMPKIAKLGKFLGTKGLMPNPKNGTISTDLKTTINQFKSGMSNFKMKEVGKLTGLIGKVDMKTDKLKENFEVFYTAVSGEISKLGPNVLKSIKLVPTMGPAVIIDQNSI